MKNIKILLLLLLLASTGYGQSLSPRATATDGGRATGGGVSLSYTIGETFNSKLSANNQQLTQGQQQPEIDLRVSMAQANLCAGTSFFVPYTASGYVDASNTFKVELSNATGSFANPVVIGSVSSMVSGTINATLPIGISGAGYKARVVSSNPARISGDLVAVLLTPLTENVTTLSVCGPYTWANNGQTYTTSGVYTGLTANCVTEKLNLTINVTPTPLASPNFNVVMDGSTCSSLSGLYILNGTRNGKNSYDWSLNNFSKIIFDGTKWIIYWVNTSNVLFSNSTSTTGLVPPLTGWVRFNCTGDITITPETQTFCSGATVANLVATGTALQWYAASTGGSALATTTSLASGTYYLSQTVSGCESSRTAVTVTINTTLAPTASSQTFCTGATVANLVATGTALQWYAASTGGTSLATSTALATGTYYVSQTLNSCESSRTAVAVTVNNSTTPSFTQVAAISAGGSLSALPTTSNNSITGTWSPALNNTATTTYTFTPATGQCATTATMTITVNLNVTPTFAAVASICSGGSLSALPTTSNNGITGTWSPALNNLGTTTYTFTPTIGQSATTTTMTITVNPNVTPEFTAVTPICAGESLSALPTTSNDGITGTWSPALDNATTTTYTFTPTAGQCATTTTLTINVNPNVTPTFTAVAPICAGESLADLPTTSNDCISGTWSPALNNLATTTYTFIPNAGQCASITTLTITVNPIVTPTFTAIAEICSGASLSALPTTSNNAIAGTWSPALNNMATNTYTFTPATGQCANTATMTITVNPKVTPTFTAVAAICSGASLSALATTSINGITGTWSPALNNAATTTYTFTPATGQCGTTATMTIAVTTTPAPIAVGNQSYSGVATLANLSVTGTAIQWYNGASGGSVLPASTALVDGTTYFVSQTLGSCESARTAVSVNITIPSTLTFCNEARVADAVGTSTLKFYQFLTGSSALAARTLLTTRTYFVTQVINGIESSPRVPVGVTLNPLPARIAAITASDDNLCKYIGTTNTVTYTATPGALSYIWTVPAGVTIIGSQDTNILTVNFQAATISGAGIIGNIVVRGVNAIGCASGPERAITLSTLLPAQPSRATLTHNGVVQTTVGNFVGDSTKTLVLEATDNSNTANRYTWELPAGVSVVSGDATADRIISIHLGGVAPGNTDLVFKVSSVAGCGTSAARSVAVTRSAPGSPRALVLTDEAISSVNPILIVSGYTGKFKTTPLTLTATPRTGTGIEATSYKWVLPYGIGIVDASATFVSENSGFKTYTSTANAIKINLSGVGTATSLLLNVFGVNGNGESLLSRDLTLTSAIPARPGTLTSASGGTATYHPTCGTITVRIPNVFGVTYTWSVKGGAMATIPSTNSNGNEATINVSQLPTIVNSSFRIGVIASNGTGSSSETIYTIRLGSACSVGKFKANDDNTAKVTNEFKVIAYPNPSSNVFTIKIQSLDQAKTELSVYDTAGRLVEKLQAQTNEVDLGSKYPAGVYNLIVKQGKNVKTVRVVKK